MIWLLVVLLFSIKNNQADLIMWIWSNKCKPHVFNDHFLCEVETVLLKGEIVFNKSVSVSFNYWKNVLDVKFLIEFRFLRQNYNLCNSIKSDFNPYHDFEWKLMKSFWTREFITRLTLLSEHHSSFAILFADVHFLSKKNFR